MTALEWLQMHFLTWLEDGGRYFSPVPGVAASADFFIAVFGGALEQALAAGTSTYDALMGVKGGTGWEQYFDEWKQRGILT